MTDREHLHQMIDQISDDQVKAAIATLGDVRELHHVGSNEEMEEGAPPAPIGGDGGMDNSADRVPVEKAALGVTQEEQARVDASNAAFFALLNEIADNAPKEDCRNRLADLSENLDHYLYGAPER